MLTGRHPFGGGHQLAAVYAILHDDPVPPSRVRPEIPAAWDAIVAGLLRKNPADRFATAQVVLAELKRALPAPEPVPRATPSRRRHAVWMVGLALVVGGAAIAAGAAAVKGRLTADGFWLGGPATSVAVLPLLNASGDTANDHFADGLTIELIGALSKVRGLHVAAHTSVFALEGKDSASARLPTRSAWPPSSKAMFGAQAIASKRTCTWCAQWTADPVEVTSTHS
jgi:hypothetical protein